MIDSTGISTTIPFNISVISDKDNTLVDNPEPPLPLPDAPVSPLSPLGIIKLRT